LNNNTSSGDVRRSPVGPLLFSCMRKRNVVSESPNASIKTLSPAEPRIDTPQMLDGSYTEVVVIAGFRRAPDSAL